MPDNGSVLVIGKCVRANGDVVELLSRVKVKPTSQINPALPSVGLEKWLDTQGGTDAAIAWVVRTADESERGISLREAEIPLQGRPALVIMVAAGNITGRDQNETNVPLAPSDTGGDYAERYRLRDLRVALKRARPAPLRLAGHVFTLVSSTRQ